LFLQGCAQEQIFRQEWQVGTASYEKPAQKGLPEAAGTAGALGHIVASVSDAMTDRTWFRLKACADERCRWAFYDQSKNRSGHWCSMEVCGNRSKARQFRRRQRAAS